MKKITALCLLLCLIAGLCAGCGGEKAGFAEKDLVLVVNGQTVTPTTEVSALLGLLGQDYDYAEAVSCVYEGLDKTYSYPEAVVYTYPGETGEKLMELYVSGGDVKTGRGLGLGASLEELTAAYGEPTSSQGKTVSYELSAADGSVPAALSFFLRDGKVESISLIAEHREE